MLEYLQAFDYSVLRTLNVDCADPSLDQFWLTVTQLHKFTAVQAFVFPAIVLWLFYIYRMQALKPLLVLAVAIGLADALSYRVIKFQVQRQRPFQNSEISQWVRKVGEAHGPSFPSNHATNAFAAATVLSWYFPVGAKFFYIFAAIVAVSRVVLGVHYPSDVLAGAGLGIFVGFLIRICLLNQCRWFIARRAVSKTDGNSYSWRTRTRRME